MLYCYHSTHNCASQYLVGVNRMNEYEECLFYYIMEHEWPDLLEQEAYQVLAESRDEALHALTETFTSEQRRLYMAYEPRCNAACSAEMQYLFHKSFRLGLHLARL